MAETRGPVEAPGIRSSVTIWAPPLLIHCMKSVRVSGFQDSEKLQLEGQVGGPVRGEPNLRTQSESSQRICTSQPHLVFFFSRKISSLETAQLPRSSNYRILHLQRFCRRRTCRSSVTIWSSPPRLVAPMNSTILGCRRRLNTLTSSLKVRYLQGAENWV